MSEVQGPPRASKTNARPEPALAPPPFREKIRRKFEDKGITRRQLLGAAGVAAGLAVVSEVSGVTEVRERPATLFKRRRTPSTTSNAGVTTTLSSRNENGKPTVNDAIRTSDLEGKSLPLRELIAVVETQNDGNIAPIAERIGEYNAKHHGHETVTLDADQNRNYHKTDTPVLGIYKVLPPAILRSTPRNDEDNILMRLTDDTTTGKVFNEGYVLGYDILGSQYDGSDLGKQKFDIGESNTQGIYDYGGIWIGVAKATEEADGTNTFFPDDRFLPEDVNNFGAIPSIAALRATAVPLDEARTILAELHTS